MFRKLEEPGAGLHVAALVNNDDAQHASTCGIFNFGKFAEQVKEALVMGFKPNGLDLCREVRIRNHSTHLRASSENICRFLLCCSPLLWRKSVVTQSGSFLGAQREVDILIDAKYCVNHGHFA